MERTEDQQNDKKNKEKSNKITNILTSTDKYIHQINLSLQLYLT